MTDQSKLIPERAAMLAFPSSLRVWTCQASVRRWRHNPPTIPFANSGFLNVDALFSDGDAPKSPKSVDPDLVCPTFRSWIDRRRAEAKRSLLVQVRSSESAQDLLNYCQATYGPVKAMDFHNNPQNPDFPVSYLCTSIYYLLPPS